MSDVTHRFEVPDMDCEGCVRAITAALRDVDAGAEIRADLGSKQVAIRSAAGTDALGAAIRQAGFAIA